MNSSLFVPPRALVVRGPHAPRAGIAGVSGVAGVVMPPEEAWGVIDRYPVLAVAAASAARGTRLCDLAKRRVRQSAQHAATVALLQATKVPVRVDDDMIVNGGHADELGGRPVQAPTQHRLAAGTVMMGPAARSPIKVGDLAAVDPMNRLGTGPAERGA